MCNAIWEQYPSASIHVLLPWEVVGESAWAPYTPQPEEVVLATQNGLLDLPQAQEAAEQLTQYTDGKHLHRIAQHVRGLLQPGIPLVSWACASKLHIPTTTHNRRIPCRFANDSCLSFSTALCDDLLSTQKHNKRMKSSMPLRRLCLSVCCPTCPPFRRCWWEYPTVQSPPQHLPRRSTLQRFGLHQAVRTPPLWFLPFAVLSSSR